jgi:hypothetical protein
MPFVRAPRSSVITAQIWPVARGALASFIGALERRVSVGGDDLAEARELLAYWERRARRLPRWSVLRRREARAMARIWRERVSDAERLRYGPGVIGAMSLYAAERRVPAKLQHRGNQIARVAGYAAITAAVAMLVLVVAVVAVVADAALSAL